LNKKNKALQLEETHDITTHGYGPVANFTVADEFDAQVKEALKQGKADFRYLGPTKETFKKSVAQFFGFYDGY